MKRFFALAVLLLILCAPPSLLAQTGAPRGISPCTPNSIAVSGTSSNVQLSTCGSSLIIMNITSQEAFFKIGQLSTTAATTTVTDSYSIPGNSFELLTVPGLAGVGAGWYFAAITSTSTTTIRLIQGNAQ
jgi:hypothetical protein